MPTRAGKDLGFVEQPTHPEFEAECSTVVLS